MKVFTGLTKVTVLTLALTFGMGGCAQKTPEELVETAKKDQQQGDHKTAIVELKNALQQQPNNREARLLLGISLYTTGEYASSEKELKKARELGASADHLSPILGKTLLALGEYQRVLDEIYPSPTLSTSSLSAIHICRVNAYMALGKKTEARQALDEAEKADAGNADYFLAKSRFALLDGQKDQAMQWVEKALLRDEKFNDALYLKAGLLHAQGREDEALKLYQQIVANDAKQVRALLAITSLHLRKGNDADADQTLKEAEKVAANALMVKYTRGIMELSRGKLREANDALLQALKMHPNHLPSMLAYATVNAGLGNYEQSISYAKKVVGAQPHNQQAIKILAGSMLKKGDIHGALVTLTPLIGATSDDPHLLAMAGEAYLKAKQYNKAMELLDRASKLAPQNTVLKQKLAAGHLAMGDTEQALVDLQLVSSQSEQSGPADIVLIMLHLGRNELDQALQAIDILEKKLPENPITLNLRAAALLGKRDNDGARKVLIRALSIQPAFLPAAINLARLDMKENNPGAARKRFEGILDTDKHNVQAMLALAALADINKQESERVRWLERATQSAPKSIPPRVGLAQYYLEKQDTNKALKQAREAVFANPDSIEALNLLADIQLAAGDKAGSLTTLTSIVRKQPSSPEALLRLALSQIDNKQSGAARDTLLQAIRLRPDFPQAQDALLRLELADNKPEAAMQLARQIQAQHPESPLGFEREADLLLSQKRVAQAVKLYEQALAKGAGSVGMIKLHRALSLAGNAKTAEQRLSDWLKQYPKDGVVRTYAAESLMASNRYRDAIAQYEEVIKLAPENAQVLNNLANLYLQEKDPRALATAEHALRLAPNHPGVQDTLGWVLVKQGQTARGLTILRKAVGMAPKAVTIRYHLAVALANTGNKAEARKELGKLLSIGQDFPEAAQAKALLKNLGGDS